MLSRTLNPTMLYYSVHSAKVIDLIRPTHCYHLHFFSQISFAIIFWNVVWKLWVLNYSLLEKCKSCVVGIHGNFMLALNRLTSRLPKSYTFNAESLAVSYRTRDNNVKMTSTETTNGGVRSNGGSRDYTRVCRSCYCSTVFVCLRWGRGI